MECDKLVEIPASDWIELRDIFLLNWPDNHVAWHTINNYVNWHRKQSYIRDLKIYSLNNSWRSDGTYVVVVSRTSIKFVCLTLKVVLVLEVFLG